ncbi:MAG: hypothetical protein ABR543_03175 [Gemmatimonadaceae bacterium]
MTASVVVRGPQPDNACGRRTWRRARPLTIHLLTYHPPPDAARAYSWTVVVVREALGARIGTEDGIGCTGANPHYAAAILFVWRHFGTKRGAISARRLGLMSY